MAVAVDGAGDDAVRRTVRTWARLLVLDEAVSVGGDVLGCSGAYSGMDGRSVALSFGGRAFEGTARDSGPKG